MPTQTLDTLFRSLKQNQVAPVYYLYGPEDVLKEEAVKALVDRVLEPSLKDFNFDQRSAGQLDPEAVLTLCTTLPMMADRRVVILRDLEGWRRRPKTRAAFLKYLERPAGETVVILVQSSAEGKADTDLVRGAFAVACEPLPPERAKKWLQHRAGALGVRLEEGAADHLLRAVGGDLGALAAELQKLAGLPEGTPLTVGQVGDIVGVRHGETVYDWRDAVFDSDPGRAVTLLGPLLDQPGGSAVRLVTLVGTTLVGLGIARDHFDRRVREAPLADLLFKTLLRVRIFGLLDYRSESARWARWAASWSPARIGAALRDARDADRAIKSTTIADERAILADLIFRMTVPYREAA